MLKGFFLSTAVALFSTGYACADTYNRIAVAGGDITEIIYALGAGDRVIAVDSTSGFPESVKAKAQIGYVRALSAEGVLSISPDLLIGADDTGPKYVLKSISDAGLPVALAPKGKGEDRVIDKIRFVGETLDLQEEAEALITEYLAKMGIIDQKRNAITKHPKVIFILSLRDGAPVVGGNDTSANDIIELAGGSNVASAFSGWKPMSAEAIIRANPDYILMSSTHADRIGGDDKILKRPDIALTTAGKNNALIKMDAMLLLGFGPRTATAVSDLMGHLHLNGE
jgi:iron complex transport system substrate-binding protein